MYRFVVCGRGEFPYSLLKEQGCYPASLDDYKATCFNAIWLTPSSYGNIRYVTLDSTKPPKESVWQTFGWKIIQ